MRHGIDFSETGKDVIFGNGPLGAYDGFGFVGDRGRVVLVENIVRSGSGERFERHPAIGLTVLVKRLAVALFRVRPAACECGDDLLYARYLAARVAEVIDCPKVIYVPAERFENTRAHCHAVAHGRNTVLVFAVANNRKDIFFGSRGSMTATSISKSLTPRS